MKIKKKKHTNFQWQTYGHKTWGADKLKDTSLMLPSSKDYSHQMDITQLTFTYSKSSIKSLGKKVKSVQS